MMERWYESYPPINKQNARDTQFQGYAKLVVMEIAENENELLTDILARRFYDLACYVNQFMPGVENVPDIEKWDDL
jgi:hypothetical protein